jgi:pimeloyl-ACP methyl ester carboxylesterase
MRASCILLALLAGACGAESDSDTRMDAQPAGPVDGYVDIGGINLHYRDYGGTGELLVFVPGFYMTAHVYDQLAQHFTDRYRVLALTYRWHGTSDTTGLDFDPDTLANDVAGFIDHFTEDPAVVVGWATAGLVLPRLARQRPDLVRALVFANAIWASVPLPPGLPRWPPGGTPPDSVYPSLEAAAEHMQPSMNITSTAALIGVLAGYLHQRADGMYAWLPPFGTPAEARFYAWYDSAAVYDGLDVPVLAIQVQQSAALAADYEARGIPRDTIDLALRWYREYYDVSLDLGVEALRAAVRDAEVIVLDDLNHNYMIENPDVVAPIIGDFVRRLDAAGNVRPSGSAAETRQLHVLRFTSTVTSEKAPGNGHRSHTGTRSARGHMDEPSIGNSADACLHGGHAEVHQQSQAHVHDLQVREQLPFKHRVARTCGLDFDNDGVVDEIRSGQDASSNLVPSNSKLTAFWRST